MGFGVILPFLNRCIMSMSLTLKSTLRHSDSLMTVSSKSLSSSSDRDSPNFKIELSRVLLKIIKFCFEKDNLLIFLLQIGSHFFF